MGASLIGDYSSGWTSWCKPLSYSLPYQSFYMWRIKVAEPESLVCLHYVICWFIFYSGTENNLISH